MIEVEPINCRQYFIGHRVCPFLVRFRHRHPLLQFRLTDDAVAVQLVPTTHKRVEGLLSVLLEEIYPYGVIPATKAGTAEVVRVDACAKTIALEW